MNCAPSLFLFRTAKSKTKPTRPPRIRYAMNGAATVFTSLNKIRVDWDPETIWIMDARIER